ncbi:recombination regulator RecX [Clostridium kluyveri]|uniref:Regulatory protein RecX n=1 Tax=Clostridium kluyveri TaxID=1534 RepID=A0A1L5FC55_CLOKL|nr:recombination regulator RecX [Clostridium kluyveri]APM40598.1 recombination regulator RecX [Clostridium kluyveri]UZQ49280.1 recombination regulator RecX [Clostridium kluyveri]
MNEYAVTKVEIQKRNNKRVNIYLNEEFAFSCSAEIVYKYNICKGKILDVDYLKDIIYKDNYIRCKRSALYIIEKSYKTEKQMYDKLIKNFDEGIVKECIKFLKEYNFIDDNKFAEMYVKEKIHSQGRNKIKYSLIEKGIKESIIDEKLYSIDNSLEEKIAFDMAKKKYYLIIKSENNINKVYNKLGNYMVKNGYDFDLVRYILKKIIKEHNCSEEKNNIQEDNKDELYNIAKKRYGIIIKSEDDPIKIYKKLGAYLLRRGYLWENIRSVLKELI